MGPRTTLLLAAAVVAALLTASALAVTDAGGGPGNPTVGKALFSRPGLFCGSCHALKAARSTGRSGPNLDRTKPSYTRIVQVVTNGVKPSRRWPGGMPGYDGPHAMLDKSRIRDIAAFVFEATHR
jgi:mono/diheme cytochrome c family protein